MSPESPIVVLDSGLGGLTVVRELRNSLPQEDILYFGDTARLPYGTKTAHTVSGFIRQIITYLLPSDPKHVVIACNTATALALPQVRAAFPGLTISGVVEPGAKAAVIAAGSKQVPTIGIIATEATIKSKAYERAIHRRRNHARIVLRPTPLLVPMIEEGRHPGDPLVRLALEQYLKSMIQHGLDVMVLGCTHYPIFKGVIQKMVGGAVAVIDSARQCADDVAARLGEAGMLRGAPRAMGSTESAEPSVPAESTEAEKRAEPKESVAPAMAADPATRGILRCFVTDDPDRFQRLAPRFLGVEIAAPALVPPEELYGPERKGVWRMRLPA